MSKTKSKAEEAKAKFKPGTTAARFLELAQPDEDGFSRMVELEELKANGLGFGNGSGWCRPESLLARTYNVRRKKQNPDNPNSKNLGIKLEGFYTKQENTGQIRADIKREIKKRRCVVLGTSKPEVDHKDGRKEVARLSNPEKQKITDFQPLSPAANKAKRSACRKCKETNQRFDATSLGYPIAQWKGNGKFYTCVGCFWHDPVVFRKALQKKK